MTDPASDLAPWAQDGPFSDDDLTNTLDEDAARNPEVEWPGADSPVRRWTIDGDNTAEWAMAKAAAASDELEALAEQAREWAAKIQDWFDHRAAPLSARMAFFEGHLERYALAVREASGDKTKSVTLPSGTVRTTSHAAKVVIEDLERVTKWALQRLPEAVEHKVGLTALRAGTVILEVPTRLSLACGCVVTPTQPEDGVCNEIRLNLIRVDVPHICADCGETKVAAWLDTVAYAVSLDWQRVPGASVEPGRVTAKVSAK